MIFREWLFKIASVLSLVIGAYHLVGIFYPVNSSSPPRHFVLLCICLICAYGFIKRTKFFAILFFVLLIQQFISHGQSLITEWSSNRIDWISLMLLIFMPLLLVSLFIDLKSKSL